MGFINLVTKIREARKKRDLSSMWKNREDDFNTGNGKTFETVKEVSDCISSMIRSKDNSEDGEEKMELLHQVVSSEAEQAIVQPEGNLPFLFITELLDLGGILGKFDRIENDNQTITVKDTITDEYYSTKLENNVILSILERQLYEEDADKVNSYTISVVDGVAILKLTDCKGNIIYAR